MAKHPLRFWVSVGLLMTAVLVSTRILRTPGLEIAPAGRLAIALVPIPFAVWVIAEYVRIVRALDEFHRRVLLESLAIAYPLAMLLGMTTEYVQKAGFLLEADVGRLWPLMALLWPLTFLYAYRRYRA